MNKIIISLITVLILTSLIINVSAVSISKSNNQINVVDTGEVQPFSLSNFINSIFGVQPNLFSVIGKANRYGNVQCSTTEDHEFGPVNGGQTLTIPNNVVDTYCGSDNDAIFDVFVNSYTGYMEFNWDGLNDYLENPAPGLHSSTTSTFTFTCASTRTDCRVQIYCCKDYIPTGQGDCDSGAYTENSCSSWINGGYKCTWEGEIESQIPWAFDTFGYCASGSTIDCYYYSGTGSTCTKYVSPDATCSGEFMSHTLYDSKATCEGNINTLKTCSSLSGTYCLETQGCTGNFVSSIEGNKCCIGACKLGGCILNCVGKSDGDSDGCGGTCNSGISGKLSLTEGAFGEATAETIIKATCSLGSECPRDKEHILTDEYANVEDYNWTVRCMTSASIQMSNKASIEAYVKKKGAVISWIYGQTCKDTTVYSLSNWITSMIGLDLCSTIESELPSGTCRATPSSSGCIWSEPHKWIGQYTKADCNTDLFIFIGGLVMLLFLIMKFAG